MGKWIQANPEVAFIRRPQHFRRICDAPYTWTIPRPAESWFDSHYLSPLLFLRSFVALFLFFFSFCAKPSADLGLVGLSLSLTTLAGLSDRLSKIPLGRERPQTAICCLEWLGRWKCLATGLDASLSFLSTSRRCSRNRSPSRLPVSPKNFIDDNSALHVLFYDLSTLLQSNRRVTWPTFSQRWYLALAFLIEEVFKWLNVNVIDIGTKDFLRRQKTKRQKTSCITLYKLYKLYICYCIVFVLFIYIVLIIYHIYIYKRQKISFITYCNKCKLCSK